LRRHIILYSTSSSSPKITGSSNDDRASSKQLNLESTASTMAGPGAKHPIHIHPVRPLYRFAATGLGASMWFFLMYRAKKDGAALMGWKHPWDH